jgi:hypothetical protein
MSSDRKTPETVPPPEPEIQQGHGRSRTKDDEVKRILKQHPRRDEPRVDSVEEGDTPPP